MFIEKCYYFAYQNNSIEIVKMIHDNYIFLKVYGIY